MYLIKYENWTQVYHITEKEHALNVDVNASLKFDEDFGYYIDLNWDYLIGLKSSSGKKEKLIDPCCLDPVLFDQLEKIIKEDLLEFWL
ncbi:MAG: hypothetical protein GY756_01645 [bacterium]|nr:hypothetical protein [bacterium]